MPNPRIHTNGELLFGLAALVKQPEMAMLMAVIICRWTLVGTHTAMLFTTLLPNETDTAHDIYLNFFAPETRAQVFLTVARRKLSKGLYKKAEEFLQELRKIMKDRNIIAHGL